MNLLPFDSFIANVLLMAIYSILVGAVANIVVAASFSVLDKKSLRRR